MLRASMSIMSLSAPLRPVVAVIGTTGVGKSQLAVSLAQSLARTSSLVNDGVILSADSMQLYKGLDVITNKVNEQEKGGIKHWGLDLVQPGEGGSWELGKWCNEAGKQIETMPLSCLPIICGGTHYFIQHFLFPPSDLQLQRPDQRDMTSIDPLSIRWTPPRQRPSIPPDLNPELEALLDSFWTTNPVWPKLYDTSEGADLEELSSDRVTRRTRPVAIDSHQLLSMWKLLEAVDPREAGRWHWRDQRKVRRGLERWWERGGIEVGSTTVVDGVQSHGKGRRARFRTLIFWVYEPMETLQLRLDKRVDKMVQNGLLQEIEELRNVAANMYGSLDAVDHSEGIFQAIGYKEFADLSLPQPDPISSPLFQSMLERTKLSTHQYAKSQLKWIRKQLLPTIKEVRELGGEAHVYVVPGGASGETTACDILEAFLCDRELPDPLSVGYSRAGDLLQQLYIEGANVPNTADRQLLNSRCICEVCSLPNEPFSVRSQDWEDHLSSKIHKRAVKLSTMSRAEWIEAQKVQGRARNVERQLLRQRVTPAAEDVKSVTAEL